LQASASTGCKPQPQCTVHPKPLSWAKSQVRKHATLEPPTPTLHHAHPTILTRINPTPKNTDPRLSEVALPFPRKKKKKVIRFGLTRIRFEHTMKQRVASLRLHRSATRPPTFLIRATSPAFSRHVFTARCCALTRPAWCRGVPRFQKTASPQDSAVGPCLGAYGDPGGGGGSYKRGAPVGLSVQVFWLGR